MSLPVLVTTTHSSGSVPFDILADMLGESAQQVAAREARLRYLFHEGDPYTDMLFHAPGAAHVGALTSRFVVDLNRRRDEGGLNGVIKVTDFSGNPLYPEGFQFTEEALEDRLARYYDPFHATVARLLAQDDILFFVDGHAMTPRGPLIGPDQGLPRPAFCIITGGDQQGERLSRAAHTSVPAQTAREVVALLETHFEDIVRDTPGVPPTYLINAPFAAGGVQQMYSDPRRPYAKPGFSLEFNRALYLRPGPDGLDEAIPGRVEALNTRFRAFLADLAPLFARLHQDRRLSGAWGD
jgi:N-formylglutamate deformylase